MIHVLSILLKHVNEVFKGLYMYNCFWPVYCFFSISMFVRFLLCKWYILSCRKSPGSAVPSEMPGSWEEDMDYVFGLQGQSQVLGSLWLQHCVRGTSPSDRGLVKLIVFKVLHVVLQRGLYGRQNQLIDDWTHFQKS